MFYFEQINENNCRDYALRTTSLDTAINLRYIQDLANTNEEVRLSAYTYWGVTPDGELISPPKNILFITPQGKEQYYKYRSRIAEKIRNGKLMDLIRYIQKEVNKNENRE